MYQLYHNSLLNANKISKKIAFLYRKFISLLWKKESSLLKCLINNMRIRKRNIHRITSPLNQSEKNKTDDQKKNNKQCIAPVCVFQQVPILQLYHILHCRSTVKRTKMPEKSIDSVLSKSVHDFNISTQKYPTYSDGIPFINNVSAKHKTGGNQNKWQKHI